MQHCTERLKSLMCQQTVSDNVNAVIIISQDIHLSMQFPYGAQAAASHYTALQTSLFNSNSSHVPRSAPLTDSPPSDLDSTPPRPYAPRIVCFGPKMRVRYSEKITRAELITPYKYENVDGPSISLCC